MKRLFVLFLFLALPTLVNGATDTGKFDFYYQKIEKVVQLEPEQPPSSVWDYVKNAVRKGTNFVKKVFEKTVTRNLFPGQGTKLWYSEGDSKIAYQVKRVKVLSEQHLLQLMGASDGDESKLNDGQKSLLAVYRNANQERVKDLASHALYPRITVHLSDTSGFEDSSKFPHMEKDFWPKSMGFSITMPSFRYAYSNSGNDAVSTFIHETAHCTNLTVPEFIKPYGLDGSHFLGEKTKPRMAFQEAWSEYQEGLFDSNEASRLERNSKIVKIEDTKVAGKYTTLPVGDSSVSGQDCFSCEAMNAYMMLRLSRELPDGEAKVQKAFFHQNFPWRDMRGFLKGFAKLYPAEAGKIGKIIDEVTVSKLSDQELSRLIGSGTQAQSFLAERREKAAVAQSATIGVTPSESASKSVNASSASALSAAGTTAAPSDMSLQAQLEAAQRKYLDAAKNGSVAGIKAARDLMNKVREKIRVLQR
jgi:hypothetical protein